MFLGIVITIFIVFYAILDPIPQKLPLGSTAKPFPQGVTCASKTQMKTFPFSAFPLSHFLHSNFLLTTSHF